MEKTKCKLCGDKHWSREVCKAIGDTPRAQVRKDGKVMPLPISSGKGEQGARSPVAASVEPATQSQQIFRKRKSAGSFDRNTYQREYMRKRRADEKLRKLALEGLA